MVPHKVTIRDVARRAGVSIATVSRLLNKSSYLKKETRRKIEKAIKELNYNPSIYARGLAGGKLNTVGLIIPGYEGIFHSFYALRIIRDVAIALDDKGVDLHLHIFWGKDNFKSHLVDGVIFADIMGNQSELNRIVKEELPHVVINRKMDETEGISSSTEFTTSYVAIDNFGGAYEAVEFLINRGHKRIAHLAGDLKIQCSKERLDGYKCVLEKYNLGISGDYIKVTNFSRFEAKRSLVELFGLKNPPTAIFCCSDDVAIEVLTFAEVRRLNVPHDLSVIGFDDNPSCSFGNNIRLTTVRQPLDVMANKGVEILNEIIDKKVSLKKVILKTELIVRDTAAKVASRE